MALTTEQIKNLKPGDPLVINGEYIRHHSDGDIVIKCNMTRGGILATDSKYLHPSCVSLPPEIVNSQSSTVNKYAPTRLFKKGDKVKLTKWNGRICEKFFREGIYCGENLTVVRDEDCFLNVTVRTRHGIEKAILSPFLELVTPVEELEPYKLIDSPNTYNIVRDIETVMTIHKKSHPHAKAAAEAERDRLNAEHRKEHENE